MRKYWTEAKLLSQILLLLSKGLDGSVPPALLSATHLFFMLGSASWNDRCPHSSSIFNLLGCPMQSRSSFRAPCNGLLGPHELPGLSLRNYSAHTEDLLNHAGKFSPPLFPSVLHDSKANTTWTTQPSSPPACRGLSFLWSTFARLQVCCSSLGANIFLGHFPSQERSLGGRGLTGRVIPFSLSLCTILGSNHSFLVPFLSSIYIACISFCSICSFLL